MRIGFMGAGKMATAIAKGLLKHGNITADQIKATDISKEARVAFSRETAVECYETPEPMMKRIDVLVLAVKPQVAAEAVAAIEGQANAKLIISIAAGLPISNLSTWFGHQRIIRVMPNTPLMVSKGASVFACGAAVTNQDRDIAQLIFGSVGIVKELDESQINAVTAVSGSGPAYVFEMIQSMVEGGVAVGLPRETALELATATVAGAAQMVADGMGTPDDLRNAVTSKGGTTAEGLGVMQRSNFRQIIADTIQAAHNRAVALGKGS